MKKFVAALSLVVFSFGFVSADEMRGKITKVSGTTVTFTKAKAKGTPKGTKAEPMTLTTASNVKVSKGKYDKKTKTVSTDGTLEGGLSNALFTTAKKGVNVQITTNTAGQITEVVVLENAKKKKKKTE